MGPALFVTIAREYLVPSAVEGERDDAPIGQAIQWCPLLGRDAENGEFERQRFDGSPETR